jgi:hypothetical protein
VAIRNDLIGARTIVPIVSKSRPVLLQALVIVVQITALILNILAIAANILSSMPDVIPAVMNIRGLGKNRRPHHNEARDKQSS